MDADLPKCDFIEELMKIHGITLEIHQVTTEDGYILSLYHMKCERSCSHRRPPVLLVHGLGSNGAVWVNVKNGLGYYLADNGYDVWLANCRGTVFSNKHVIFNCNKDRRKYWDFSWHEIGYYDIPAFIDCVLEKTHFSKIFYIGHSQGTTVFMVLMSTRPEYNTKICLCTMLAASAIYDNTVGVDSVVKYTSARFLQMLFDLFGNSPIPFVIRWRQITKMLASTSWTREYILFPVMIKLLPFF
ncbi:hypothetical protein HHI36_009461 [Cryptolaemus montrouzieri]|uniref:Partial AB-hydrolase lipase domain-containing protein n=1 Tax=Cryptolaemus montrouzieri TaxID=559131 RepID=A0ABD2MFQ4_9CUCU